MIDTNDVAEDTAPRAASAATRTANATVRETLPFDDRQAFEDAARGFVATIDPPTIRNERGTVVWDLTPYDFLDAEAPDTVHPSLWRMAQLNRHHGLFRVSDRIYQVRGFDISNMTVIEGDTGFIVIDPLTCVETARAAIDLVRAHLGDRPVTAVIFSHSHADHFGGVRAVAAEADVRAGRIPVVAPAGFYEHAVSENVHAGVAMRRRAEFMFGARLPRGPRAHVTTGLGVTLPRGTTTLIEPNDVIATTGTERVLDGVRFVFQFTPGAEAPAEMNFHLPDLRALCMAETVSQQMHNLYTPRGAQVRDALAWSNYLDEAIRLFGADSDVLFISHHWPTWGSERIVHQIGMHRDLYRYIHDETLRLANHGYGPVEIAELVQLPEQLSTFWANRGCYGALNHNVKAVYQLYLGWFDGNPANLHPLPPAETGGRYVELMGGLDTVLDRAREAADAGDHRWAAELLKHALAADPGHRPTRELQADVFEQLGYQSESGPWRNFFLLGAEELRNGTRRPRSTEAGSSDVVSGMSSELLLDYLAIRLNGPAAARVHLRIGLHLTDTGERFLLTVQNGLLRHSRGSTTPDTTLHLEHRTLAALAHGGTTLEAAERNGATRVDGRRDDVGRLFALLDTFTGSFDVLAPNPPPAAGGPGTA
nr:alkyl sulfatase dimerization domain-containing protein [Pseudonocardia sp. C8]